MELPRVVHLHDAESWALGTARDLLRANGRTLAVVLGDGPRPDDLPALSRHVKVRSNSPALLAASARLAGARLVHAHDEGRIGDARRLAEKARLPWSATSRRWTWDRAAVARLAGATFVAVPDVAAAVCAGIPAHAAVELDPDLDLGAHMAVLEAHWLSALRDGRPAALVSRRELPTVTVLLATYQRRHLLARCLDQLAAQTYPRDLVQIVVVDNGSTDGSADDLRAREQAGEIVVVTTGEPVLVTEARNRGLAAATGELVVFTDDDCRPVATWLTNLVNAWRVAGCGVVQGRTTGDSVQPRAVLSRTQETPFGFGLHETCNIGYPRAALGTNPFDDAIPERLREILGQRFPRDPTGEDTDLGWRMRERGLAFCFSATALVHHEIFEPDPEYLLRRARMTAVFPVLVERHPELRRAFLVGRVFLHRQRPAWWLALASPAAVAAFGAAGFTAAAPWVWSVLRPADPGTRERLRALPVTFRVEALTTVSLLRGSIHTRRLVL